MGNKEDKITIKVAGKERTYKEERHIKAYSKPTPKKIDSHATVAKFPEVNIEKTNSKKKRSESQKTQSHYEEKEKTIAQLATSKEENEDEFPWILPNKEEGKEQEDASRKVEDVRKNNKKKSQKRGTHRRGKNYLTSIFVTVFFAVLIGTSFGFIIKEYIIHDSAVEPVTGNSNKDGVSSGSEKDHLDKAKAKVVLPEFSTFVVQGGVFSNEEAAEQFAEELTEKQIPNQIVAGKDQVFLYLAISDSLEHAKELSSKFLEKEVDIYAKELPISGKTFSGLQEGEQAFLEETLPLFQTLTSASTALLLTNEVPDSLETTLKKQLPTIEKHSVSNEELKNMQQSLVTVSKAVDANENKKLEQQFVEMQNQLLHIFSLYHP